MTTHTRKARREVADALAPLGFVYDGKTRGRIHLRWLHKPTGRILITGGATGDWRAIKNTVRSAKEMLRRIGDAPSSP